LKRQQDISFDYRAERNHYASPVTVVRPYQHLEGHLLAFGKDYRRFFHGKKVLDFGGGEGLHAKVIAETAAPVLLVTVDLIFKRMLLPSQHNPFDSLHFVCGDCFHLPFLPRTFDVVFGSGILHHLRDIDPVVDEIKRVLKPGGLYLGIEPNLRNPVNLLYFRRVSKSTNEYELKPTPLKSAFSSKGFSFRFSYWWRRFPLIRSPWLTPTIAIEARYSAESENNPTP
jgi:SAM-dependent methyltransferase